MVILNNGIVMSMILPMIAALLLCMCATKATQIHREYAPLLPVLILREQTEETLKPLSPRNN
jgi:uncharacterized membrane protein